MDEVLFRGSQKVENLQFRLGLAANEGKTLLVNFGYSTKRHISHYLESVPALEIQARLKNILEIIRQSLKHSRSVIAHRFQPIFKNFTWKWINTPILLCFGGFLFGTTLGFLTARYVFQQNILIPRDKMQAIQCLTYQTKGSPSDVVSLIHGVYTPNICGPNDVIVQVEAGSLQIIDLQIAQGYGRYIRYCLNRFNKHRERACPLTLGRDCVGSILSVGVSVRRLEVGDLVWVAVPYWAPGVLAQRIIVPEHCVALRPARFGAQASCSFPYAGAVALHTLRVGCIQGRTDAANKRVLIIGGCTPVGCLLTQILRAWGAHVTVTCPARAHPVMEALGAADIIPILANMRSPLNRRATGDCKGEQPQTNDNGVDLHDDGFDQLLQRHLTERQPFNLIIVTHDCQLNIPKLRTFCHQKGNVLDTRPNTLKSDHYSALNVSLFTWFTCFTLFIKDIFGLTNLDAYNEVPMDYEVLDQLSNVLEKYRIKPVIGKVYHASDIVNALEQVSANGAIGTTVITFDS